MGRSGRASGPKGRPGQATRLSSPVSAFPPPFPRLAPVSAAFSVGQVGAVVGAAGASSLRQTVAMQGAEADVVIAGLVGANSTDAAGADAPVRLHEASAARARAGRDVMAVGRRATARADRAGVGEIA